MVFLTEFMSNIFFFNVLMYLQRKTKVLGQKFAASSMLSRLDVSMF